MHSRRIWQSLWLGAGVYFLFVFINHLKAKGSFWMAVLYGVTTLVMFANAYICHKIVQKGGQNKS